MLGCTYAKVLACAFRCACVFSASLPCVGFVEGGGEVKVETNSSLGDEGSHNYVQFSS